jgi:hypothetical protein
MKFLLDENMDPTFRVQLGRLLPELVVWRVGDAGAPPLRTPDPDILVWCEENEFHLVTNNRKSMPVHLERHLNAGRHIPGILTIDLTVSIGLLLQELKDIVELSLENEYRDRIEYVPLRKRL